MIQRIASKELASLAKQFKVVAVTGPRQSGKTTLVRSQFPEKTYLNFENPDLRFFASQDPRGFLANYPQGAILDEVQHVPVLFSYLQQVVDERNVPGQFILTGSNNLLLQESISQSLAGRVAYLFLLPLSLHEIGELLPDDLNQLMHRGFYPALYDQPEMDTSRWYNNYIRTYLERDIRLLKNISNWLLFERFVRMLAARVGQLLNMSSLANEVGVDVKTIQSWLGVLEVGFVVFRLRPYYRNFNKRLVKTPKIYFYDTGLAAALLGIDRPAGLQYHYLRGALFENMIISDFLKQRFNQGKDNNLYFWRDNTGNEIDLIIDSLDHPAIIEIKSGETIAEHYFKGLQLWTKISGTGNGMLIYGGGTSYMGGRFRVLSYRDLGKIEGIEI
ncbi:MAG TPA: ATP-binding protein [Bacteroidales bacterium]|nr:ATP-binding protein [Bacteroidales bacterium]